VLPDQFKGPWENVLIVTYGADLPFWEGVLWRELSAQCRNKIVLVDGKRFLAACNTYAESGLVRRLNHQYVAEGIFGTLSAHAKVILLTNSEQGRLLVGSGNLSWEGYAAGGEMFVQYEYGPDIPNDLGAFLGIRDFLHHLLDRGMVSSGTVRQRIDHLLETTPWLSNTPSDEWQPVRHNFEHSFAQQLHTLIGDEIVHELWIMSPFYDVNARALENLLTTLRIRHVNLLIQPGYTSANPAALSTVFDRVDANCEIHSFGFGRHHPYYHAKLYLFKLNDRAICLQGSPNLSQAAMLLTPPQGNIEVANLLTGAVDAFDDLFEDLEINHVPRYQIRELDVSIAVTDDDSPTTANWYLTGGELSGDRLLLSFQGTLPPGDVIQLIVSGNVFEVDVTRNHHALSIVLSPQAVKALEHPVPVRVRWQVDEQYIESNSVFVCHRSALQAVLEAEVDEESLRGIGDLELDDDEFERLLGELDAALIIDQRSVWHMAGRSLPAERETDEEELHLDYEDIDYDLLKKHPKIQRYLQRVGESHSYSRSRLQIVLSAITEHFRSLLEVSHEGKTAAITTLDDIFAEAEAQTEEEREEQEQEEEQQHRRRSHSQRIRTILRNFIRRYLRGIRSKPFQEWAGFEVIAQNYIIFNHVLFYLLGKREWIDPEFVIETWLEMTLFFWGGDQVPGYYEGLESTQQTQTMAWIREKHTDAEFVVGLFFSAETLEAAQLTDLRFRLRDFWRSFLRRPPFDITAEILTEAWVIVGDRFRERVMHSTERPFEKWRLTN